MQVATKVGVTLLEPFVRIDYPIRFRCLTCGTEGCKPVHEMRNATTGCWPCSRIVAGLSGRVPPAAVTASLAAVGYELVGEYVGARLPLAVRCLACSTEANVRLTSVRSKGSGCSACRYRVLAARYSLSDDEVQSRAVLAKVELLGPFTGTKDKVKTRCLGCGYVSMRTVQWSKPSGTCVRCGARPYDFTAPSVVYLLVHELLGALKIGVSNDGTNRLQDHRRQGWEIIEKHRMTGEQAYLVERAVLAWWRVDLGLPPYLSRAEMPQRGETETVSADALDVPTVLAFMRQVAADAHAV